MHRGPVNAGALHCLRMDRERRADNAEAEEAAMSAEKPNFLPMFPWYSGTSADMYRTVFGLVVSVKLFMGRFDIRTMQARH